MEGSLRVTHRELHCVPPNLAFPCRIRPEVAAADRSVSRAHIEH